VVSHGAGWRYNASSGNLSEPSLGRLAGSPKAQYRLLKMT
jgi:hypothetical protein